MKQNPIKGKSMKVLHTSDLHIGKQLLKHKLHKVHQQFFEFLIETLIQEKIDLLLISGDIFDTRFPSTTSQEIFYNFLTDVVKKTSVKDTVIISGNHDSKKIVSLVSPLLSKFNIHIVTEKEVEKQILTLSYNGEPYCNVIAVPYLSESDIITSMDIHSDDEISQSFNEALKEHFEKCENIIEEKCNKDLPTILMAHLFTAGFNTEIDKGDGVRDLYVGKLNVFDVNNFPKNIDYLALGHIHKPQILQKDDKFTYCGSPINLGFGEKSNKHLVILDFNKKDFTKKLVNVPVLMPLLQIKGDNTEIIKDKILKDEKNNPSEDSTTFMEIIYTGETLNPNLNDELSDFIKNRNKNYEILTIKIENKTLILKNTETLQALNMLTPKEIFEKIVENKLDEKGYALFDQVLEEVRNENK